MPIIPTKKPINPLVGMTIYDPGTNMMQIYNGATWVDVHASNPVYCVVCKKLTHMIENNMIPDHPFCGDNLEYLEWKNEQRERDKTRRSTRY